jgi:2-oxoisovalerate dehydrogenase E1 component beta subunit
VTEKNVVTAIHDTLHEQMAADERVVVLGEDIATRGGVFRVTQGFLEEFGEQRVIDTPLAEGMIIGVALGMAVHGLLPVAEIEFADFIHPAYDQMVSEVARMRYRTNGDFGLPMVVRAPYGGGVHGALYHSQSIEATYGHVPGIKVVVPSTPYDAKGLLLESIFDDSPVMFFEHLKLYVAKAQVPEEPYRIPLGVANVRREGSDVTVVAIAAMVDRALEAAELLASAGTSVEVIDPRTLSPLDTATIVASVEKTGALVVVDESPPHCSVASEIAAVVTEQAFDFLNAPVRRVTAPHAPVPFTPSLEDAYAPSVQKIIDAVNFLG